MESGKLLPLNRLKMKPKDFPGRNVIFAEDQPEFQNLPALLLPGIEGEVITCWSFSETEWEAMSKNRCFFLSQYCGTRLTEEGFLINNPLQPILPMAELGDNIILT